MWLWNGYDQYIDKKIQADHLWYPRLPLSKSSSITERWTLGMQINLRTELFEAFSFLISYRNLILLWLVDMFPLWVLLSVLLFPYSRFRDHRMVIAAQLCFSNIFMELSAIPEHLRKRSEMHELEEDCLVITVLTNLPDHLSRWCGLQIWMSGRLFSSEN